MGVKIELGSFATTFIGFELFGSILSPLAITAGFEHSFVTRNFLESWSGKPKNPQDLLNSRLMEQQMLQNLLFR